MLLCLVGAVAAIREDDAVKKEYGIMIQSIIKDEIDKSVRFLGHQRALRDQVLDSFHFRPTQTNQSTEVTKLKQQIEELKKQIQQAEWEDVKSRMDQSKKLMKEKLRRQLRSMVPVVGAQQAPFGTTYPGFGMAYGAGGQIRMATNGERRRRHRH